MGKYKTGLIVLVSLVFVGALAFGGIKYTSKPGFCQSCHVMNPAYASWEQSSHKTVTCTKCHVEPGLAGLLKAKANGLAQVAITVTNQVDESEIKANVPDVNCLQCHSIAKLKTDKVRYNHKDYAGKTACTFCHQQIVHP